MPVKGIATIYRPPDYEQHQRKPLPTPQKDYLERPDGGQIREAGHDETNRNVPVRSLVVERPGDQEPDTNQQGKQVPRVDVFHRLTCTSAALVWLLELTRSIGSD